jgi:hypothetical protein
MLEKSNKHASIDTFAKKLTIKNDYDSLIKLKIAMSIFFIFEQAINKPDHRYDAFFASIINHIYDFPKNIRILSWNYDYQFEIAFSEYTDQKDILPNQGLLRIIQKYGNNDIHDGFCIYKLNGTTGLYEHDGFNHYTYISNLNGPVDLTFVDKVTRNYAAAKFLQNIRPSLSFAWAPFRSNNDILAAIIENIKDTYSLVIIGYSFPFFNREVDRKIIGNMINLKKVYIQDPYANDIKERFQAIRDDLKGIEFLPRLDTGQFLLPNEL